MSHQEQAPTFSLAKILIPALLSVGVSAYLIYTNFDLAVFSSISITPQLIQGLILAALVVIVRDLAYMYRIREITGGNLGWWVSLQVILLWEYGSAITPGAVGGIALALFILRREGISYGRTIGSIMLTTILDNLAYVVVFSILFAAYGKSLFIVNAVCPDLEGHAILQGLRALSHGTWIVYIAMIFFTAILTFGLFISPGTAQRFFHWLGDIRWLSRFKNGLYNLGDDLVITSSTFASKPFIFWVRISLTTLISWVSRYALANAVIYAFSDNVAVLDMGEIFTRQYVLWSFLIVPSTPGASGLAELSFMAMNCEFIPVGLSALVATIWRLFSYYLYLIAGAFVLPYWLKRVNKNISIQ
jgi:uncharacterized membrane protein YbhN (UPF0104 family)